MNNNTTSTTNLYFNVQRNSAIYYFNDVFYKLYMPGL